MKLTRPKEITWWISVALVALAVLIYLGVVPVLTGYAFWFVVVGFILLAAGTVLKDF